MLGPYPVVVMVPRILKCLLPVLDIGQVVSLLEAQEDSLSGVHQEEVSELVL